MHGAATFCVNLTISILDYGHLLDSYWYYTLEYMHLHFILWRKNIYVVWFVFPTFAQEWMKAAVFFMSCVSYLLFFFLAWMLIK